VREREKEREGREGERERIPGIGLAEFLIKS
jgi:hypothetical protein